MSLGGIVPHEDAIATAMRGSFAAATDLAGAAHNRTSDRGFLNSGKGAHGGKPAAAECPRPVPCLTRQSRVGRNRPFPP